jgi:hypothetical protein
LGSFCAGPQDIVVSFDVSFFARVPNRDATSLPGQHFEEDILRLFHLLILQF